METAANFGQTIEGIVALLTLIGGLIALYWRIIIKINGLKQDVEMCKNEFSQIAEISAKQREQDIRINEFMPTVNSLIERVDETNKNTEKLITEVALLNTSLKHLIKQVDNTTMKIGDFEKRISYIEGKYDKR